MHHFPSKIWSICGVVKHPLQLVGYNLPSTMQAARTITVLESQQALVTVIERHEQVNHIPDLHLTGTFFEVDPTVPAPDRLNQTGLRKSIEYFGQEIRGDFHFFCDRAGQNELTVGL